MKVNLKMVKWKEKEFIIFMMVIDMKEGEFKNGKREGKGIYYYANGDREMGDFLNDTDIGRHVTLTKCGEVKVQNY